MTNMIIMFLIIDIMDISVSNPTTSGTGQLQGECRYAGCSYSYSICC